MVKEIIWEPGRKFSEFSLLTGLTTEESSIPKITLDTQLASGLNSKIPLLSAAMTSAHVAGFCVLKESYDFFN